jgi:DNA-binding NarL/FixJ family response regulator
MLIRLLTTRELQILEFAIEGFTNKEIAELHYIEETTVKRHRQNIMDKVGIAGRKQMRVFMRSVKTVLKNGAKSTISDSKN